MITTTLSLRRVGTAIGYGLLGLAVTAAAALLTLYAVQPLQRVVYDALYLQVGPSEATEAAIFTHFLAANVVGLGLAGLAGDYLSARLANRTAFGRAIGVLAALLLAFLALALAELAAFLTAVAVLGAGLVAVPLLLRYRYGVRSGGVPAFLGGVPLVVLLLLLAGFGVGWGWGYVVTAQEVPADSVTGEVASFADAPGFERDLFADGYCRREAGDRWTCSLELRGYEGEVAAARFMARHGLRCPYEGAVGVDPDSFVATHDGSYYRVTCTPHGD